MCRHISTSTGCHILGRHADRSTCRQFDTPISRHAGRSTRRQVDMPTGRHVDKTIILYAARQVHVGLCADISASTGCHISGRHADRSTCRQFGTPISRHTDRSICITIEIGVSVTIFETSLQKRRTNCYWWYWFRNVNTNI